MATVDTNTFEDVEVSNYGVLIVDNLIIQNTAGDQFDILDALKLVYADSNKTLEDISKYVEGELPMDIDGQYPLYSTTQFATDVAFAGGQGVTPVDLATVDGTTILLETATYRVVAISGASDSAAFPDGDYYMPCFNDVADVDEGTKYFLTTPHVDESVTIDTMVVDGSTDSTVDIRLNAGGYKLYSQADEDASFDASGAGLGWWDYLFSEIANFTLAADTFTDSSGGHRGVVSVSNGLYLKYDDTNGGYLNVIAAITGIFGIDTTPYDPTGVVRQSMHKFSYTIDFEVEIGVNLTPETYVADFEISNQGVDVTVDQAMTLYADNIGITVSDDTNGNTIQSASGDDLGFLTNTSIPVTVTPVSPRAMEYQDTWLHPTGHTFHTLLKGLFGQMLVNTGTVPVEVTTDATGGDGEAFIGYITDDTLLRNVVSKKVGWLTSADNTTVDNSATQSTFQDEHDSLVTTLTEAFKEIWTGDSSDMNIDWYATLYNRTHTGTLFSSGDVFSLPVEITMRYTISSDSGEPAYLSTTPGTYVDTVDTTKTLVPLSVSVTNVVTSEYNQVVEEKWRMLYNFNVNNDPLPS
jgi:hypothetical protein